MSDDTDAFISRMRIVSRMTRRSFEERIGMDREARGRWLPEEDLADIQPLSLTTNKKHTETANNE